MEVQHTCCDLLNLLQPSAFKMDAHLQETWLFFTFKNLRFYAKYPLPEYIRRQRARLQQLLGERRSFKDSRTMISVCSFLYTLVLFSELSSHLVTVAMPATKVEDSATELDGLGLILGDEPMTDPSAVYRRSQVLDNSVTDEDGRPKIIIVSVSVTYDFF